MWPKIASYVHGRLPGTLRYSLGSRLKAFSKLRGKAIDCAIVIIPCACARGNVPGRVVISTCKGEP
jgi:hypothetical protein